MPPFKQRNPLLFLLVAITVTDSKLAKNTESHLLSILKTDQRLSCLIKRKRTTIDLVVK